MVADLTGSDDEAPPQPKTARHMSNSQDRPAPIEIDSDDEYGDQSFNDLAAFTQSVDKGGTAFVQVGTIGRWTFSVRSCATGLMHDRW